MSALLPGPGIEMAVDLGVGRMTPTAQWDEGQWDFNSWGEASSSALGDWVDVTCYTSDGVTLGAGSSADGVVTRWEAASIALELLGPLFDPQAGPWAGLLGPGLPVRLRWRPAHPADNMLDPNPASMETVFSNADPLNWGWVPDANTRATPSSSSEAYDGQHFLGLSALAPPPPNQPLTVPLSVSLDRRYWVPMVEGERHDLRCHFSPWGNQPVTCSLVYNYYDADGVKLYGYQTMPFVCMPHEWTEVGAYGSAVLAGVAWLELVPTVNAGQPLSASVYIDRLSVYPAGADPEKKWRIAFIGQTTDDGFKWDARAHRASINATDGTAILAAFDALEQNPQGQGEQAADRVRRILDLAEWPIDLRDIEAGGVRLRETTLAEAAWTMLLQVADTDLAYLYLDRAGKLAYRPEGKIRPSNQVQAIVGCDVPPEYLAEPYNYLQVEPVTIDGQTPTTLRNVVSVSRQARDENDEAYTTTKRDEPSISRFLVHSYSRTDLIHTEDQWSDFVAGAILMGSAWPAEAPETMSLSSRVDPASTALLLALEPSQAFIVYRDGRAFRCTPAGWSVEIRRAEVSGAITLLDVSSWVGGQWDFGYFDFDKWGY